ncbi:MAG: asparaginase [Clostridia bacterium]|nr:asparaginase [Clostridia bacterium]
METGKLVEVTRGEMVESTHRGVVVVVDTSGKTVFAVGDPQYRTYIRSAAKPMQAVPVIERGAAQRFGLSEQELAVITASHSGEPEHQEAVNGILKKIGLSTDNLLCGTTKPLHKPTAAKMAAENIKPGPIHCPCSGKHSGMLAIAVHENYSLNDYYLLEHPVQQIMLETMAELAEMKKEEIIIGIDGCGVPVFGMPVKAMALAYANFVRPDKFSSSRQEACLKLARIMGENPKLIAGSGRFTTVLAEQLGTKIVAKDGSEGVFCLGIPEKGLGIAIKIEDGGARAMDPVILRVLDRLGLLTAEDKEALDSHYHPRIRNFRNEVIGMIRVTF